MGYSETKQIPFRPVRCSEKDFETMKTPTEGFVYFTTDTRKIYTGLNDKFVSMGGNSGIYYGNRPLAEDEVNADSDYEFWFDKDEAHIEGDSLPNVDDLILNIKDGSFYRVKEVVSNTVMCHRLVVAGSSSGSSSGGSSTAKPIILMISESKDLYFSSTETSKMKIRYKCSSPVDDGVNYIATIKYYISSQSIEENVNYKFGEEIVFDVNKYYNSFNHNGTNTLKIEVTDAYGNLSSQKIVTFTIATISLVTRVTAIAKADKNSETPYRFLCVPQGGDTLEDKKLEISLAPLNTPSNIIYTDSKTVKDLNVNYDFDIYFNDVSHGVYLLTTKYSGLIPYSTVRMYSNEINTQIIVFDAEIGTPLIASNFLDQTINQYDAFTLQYMVAVETSVNEITPTIYYGDNSEVQTATANALNTWSYTFVQPGNYTLAIGYEGSKVTLGDLSVNSYSGDIPVIDESATELCLTALGRSNLQVNRAEWVSNGYAATFEGFLWGNENGWLVDEETGETALKITNGAKVSLPTYHPFAQSAIEKGLTIELDFKVSGVLNYAKPLIHCLSQYEDALGNNVIKTGFHITGQKATLNSNNYKATTSAIDGEDEENINEQDMALQAFTQYFNEDTRIHLTYVIDYVPEWSMIGKNEYFYVYTYLNGVISGIMRLDIDVNNKTADTFQDYGTAPSYITFDSTYGDIYLYNLRIYRKALDMRTVIKNYTADLSNIDERIALYKDNNIFDNVGKINIKAIQDTAYACRVPYILFNGGNAIKKKFKDAFTYDETGSQTLPVAKDDFRLMSMRMYDVDPKTNETYLRLNIPMEVQNNADESDVVTSFSDLVSGKSYLPKRGVQVYGQGTSSMIYPVKNLRLKFIQEQDYPKVYDGSYPVEIVCLKTDYMDSSSSHNTGTGNLIYDLYKSLNLRTPPQQFQLDNTGKPGTAEYDLVTAIKGFPVICFFAEGDSQDYEYIGRYNFNLDKATPEPFGFIPQKVYTGETVTDDAGHTRQVVKVCGLETEEVKGKTVLPIDEEGNEIEKDIVQCWEIKNNNNGSPTKFRTISDYSDFKTSLTSYNSKGDNYNWTEYYEDRYPDAMVDGGAYECGDKTKDEYPDLQQDLEDGIFRVATWINSTAIGCGSDIASEATGASLPEPKYYQTMDENWVKNKSYFNSDGTPFTVETSDRFSIKETSMSNGQKLTNIKLVSETFANKVGIGNYDTYAFLYADSWTLNGETVNIAEYGISFTGTPAQNDTGLTVEYTQTNTWSNNLYEKFDTDNDDYRLSKFKFEFEDYFDLDFCLFYYVLTLTLLMMDSRAKNMMLASWDKKKWYPIFYDMDTMLGVNNTGFNKFSFDTEDDPDDKVFNGFDSVLWNNFRICFGTQIAKFYQQMRSVMTLAKLEKTYNEDSANKWNEALSSADAYYKYQRPYEEGYYDGKDGATVAPGQISYLYAAQGHRSNHRSWWLSNRLNYLDSKYLPNTYVDTSPTQNQAFNFRAYALPEQKSTEAAKACVAQTPANHQFTLTALNTSYQGLLIGNIAYVSPGIVNAGEEVVLGPTTVKHEVESYILNPQLISDLGDLSDKYIGSFNLPSNTKLLKLKLGRSSRSNPDNYDKYYNNLLSQLELGSSCPYLQDLNIARCTGLKSISLTNCSRLEKVDAEGSKVTNINFPANSILKELYLPTTLNNLILTNQPYLSKVKFDSDNLPNLNDIRLDEVPNFDSYELIKNQCDGKTIRTFYLKGFNWTITEAQSSSNMDGNTLIGIDILDRLADDNKVNVPNEYTKKQSIVGTIVIDIPGITVNEYDLYLKYKNIFPNVEIKFGENISSISPAYELIFKSENTDNASIVYQVKTDGTKTLLEQTQKATSPTGETLKVPSKAAAADFTYTFTGYWIDADGVKYATNEVSEIEFGAKKFSEFIPTKNMTFYPEFDVSITKHQVYFYDYDKTIIQQTNSNGIKVNYIEVPYNQKYTGSMLNYYYRDESDCEENERWNFVGWSQTYYGDAEIDTKTAVWVNPADLIVQGTVKLYAYYQKVDFKTIPMKEEYFELVNNGGYVNVQVKEDYRSILQGKLTIPYLIGATGIGNIGQNNTLITDVYFINGDKYLSINSNAFVNCSKLKTINISDLINLISIGSSAFMSCYLAEINGLPDSIEAIGGNAFANCRNLVLEKLPPKLNIIETGVFLGAYNVNILDFGSETNLLKSIGNLAFNNAGQGIDLSVVPELKPELTFYVTNDITFGDNCFENYANGGTFNSIKVKGNLSSEEEDKILAKLIESGLKTTSESTSGS